jgi:hypothetical protein
MHSFDKKQFHTFQADANALGGQLLEPLRKSIPPQAPVSLPAFGGFATARSGAFNLDEVISISSAHTLVTGREVAEEGAHATLVTAVVEDFNLLEVVTAKRIVAQISVTKPGDGGAQRVSFAGSRFEGLRVAGREATPRLNAGLASPAAADGERGSPATWSSFQQAVSAQAQKLVGLFGKHPDKEAVQWARARHGWNTAETTPGGRGTYSLFDGFEVDLPGAYGHIVEIPGFGRVYLGEVFISRHSVQLVSIRAELGCPVSGVATGPTADAGGGASQGNRD